MPGLLLVADSVKALGGIAQPVSFSRERRPGFHRELPRRPRGPAEQDLAGFQVDDDSPDPLDDRLAVIPARREPVSVAAMLVSTARLARQDRSVPTWPLTLAGPSQYIATVTAAARATARRISPHQLGLPAELVLTREDSHRVMSCQRRVSSDGR